MTWWLMRFSPTATLQPGTPSISATIGESRASSSRASFPGRSPTSAGCRRSVALARFELPPSPCQARQTRANTGAVKAALCGRNLHTYRSIRSRSLFRCSAPTAFPISRPSCERGDRRGGSDRISGGLCLSMLYDSTGTHARDRHSESAGAAPADTSWEFLLRKPMLLALVGTWSVGIRDDPTWTRAPLLGVFAASMPGRRSLPDWYLPGGWDRVWPWAQSSRNARYPGAARGSARTPTRALAYD
mgnify:CR=1 FL=1